MAENLRFLPSVFEPTTASDIESYYYVYDYDGTNVDDAKEEDNYSTYGVLYNWPAATSACPTGWHLPSGAEWDQLIDYLGGEYDAGPKLKEMGIVHWDAPNDEATNESGFKALPGGYNGSGFGEIGTQGHWWSATANSSEFSWSMELKYDDNYANLSGNNKDLAYSVRCVKDNAMAQ